MECFARIETENTISTEVVHFPEKLQFILQEGVEKNTKAKLWQQRKECYKTVSWVKPLPWLLMWLQKSQVHWFHHRGFGTPLLTLDKSLNFETEMHSFSSFFKATEYGCVTHSWVLLSHLKKKKKRNRRKLATLLKFLAHRYHHRVTVRILGKSLQSSDLSWKICRMARLK